MGVPFQASFDFAQDGEPVEPPLCASDGLICWERRLTGKPAVSKTATEGSSHSAPEAILVYDSCGQRKAKESNREQKKVAERKNKFLTFRGLP